MDAPPRTDLLIAGGGLAGGLVALALAARRPDVAVTIVEAAPALGGNHVWSFFDSDIAAGDRALIEPLVCHRWSGHDVAFPGLRRTLAGGYNSIESERLDAVVRAALPAGRVLTARAIAVLDPAGATLEDGTRIDAAGVIDARASPIRPRSISAGRSSSAGCCGWPRRTGSPRPLIMDATVDQAPGYRFVYVPAVRPRSPVRRGHLL